VADELGTAGAWLGAAAGGMLDGTDDEVAMPTVACAAAVPLVGGVAEPPGDGMSAAVAGAGAMLELVGRMTSASDWLRCARHVGVSVGAGVGVEVSVPVAGGGSAGAGSPLLRVVPAPPWGVALGAGLGVLAH
jgi:hypothetical protein